MKILMVCLGNICRSPLAEGVFRQKAKDRGIEIEVDSCGTSGHHIGQAPDPRSVENAQKNGFDISNLRARQFSKADFNSFDRIYVMDQSNYADVIAQADHDNHSDKVKMILNEISPKSNRPVPDPYFGGEDGFQTVFDLLDEASDRILDDIQR